jgi:23S rRNA (uracil1939-C5)-methyltransferase
VIKPIIAPEEPWRYRNKARYAADGAKVGFYAAESHALIDAPDCPIQAPPANALAGAVRRFGAASRRTDGTDGVIRELTVRTAFGTGEVMALLSVKGRRPRDIESLVSAMDDAVSALPRAENGLQYSLESVAFTSDADGGGRPVFTAGKATIEEKLGGLRFEISPRSFFQVNPVGTRALLDLVVGYAALSRTETLFDLSCGAGAFGLCCAGAAGRVVGVESSASAVADATRNAVRNGVTNAVFVRGLAERALPALLACETPHAVILDPPRAGCRAELLSAIASAAPARIVYISCDPATLARDVKRLTAAGYAFVEATPVDMFPHTAHVECVALLIKKDLYL